MQILFRPFIDWGVFEGRTARHAFWIFYTFWTVIGFFVDTFIYELTFNMQSAGLARIIGFFDGLLFFYILFVTLSLITRRFHDTGRSAWYLLLLLIPFLGNIIIFVFMLFPGQKRANIYGPDPNASDDLEEQINNSLKEKEIL